MSFDIPFRYPLPILVLMLFIKILDHVIVQSSIFCLYFLLTCLRANCKVFSYLENPFQVFCKLSYFMPFIVSSPTFCKVICYLYFCVILLWFMLGFKLNWKGNSFVQCLQRSSTNLFHVRLLLDMFFS